MFQIIHLFFDWMSRIIPRPKNMSIRQLITIDAVVLSFSIGFALLASQLFPKGFFTIQCTSLTSIKLSYELSLVSNQLNTYFYENSFKYMHLVILLYKLRSRDEDLKKGHLNPVVRLTANF